MKIGLLGSSLGFFGMFEFAGICIANTDSQHFKDLTKDIYRFLPVWLTPGDTQR